MKLTSFAKLLSLPVSWPKGHVSSGSMPELTCFLHVGCLCRFPVPLLPGALRGRVKRGTLETMIDNHGNTLIRVPVPGAGTAPPEPYRKVPTGTVPRDSVPASSHLEPVNPAPLSVPI